MNSDPLLQPFTLKHLRLAQSGVLVVARTGLQRGRHAEGSLSAVPRREGQGRSGDDDDGRHGDRVARQSAGFRQPSRLRRRDRAVDPGDDRRHPRARRRGDDPDQPPRSADGVGTGRLAAGRRPVAIARTRSPRSPEGRRALGHRPHRRRLRRRRGTDEVRRHGRRRDRGLRPSLRPVLVAGHQQARRRVRRLVRQPHALPAAGAARHPRSVSDPTTSSASGWPSTNVARTASTRLSGLEILRRLPPSNSSTSSM